MTSSCSATGCRDLPTKTCNPSSCGSAGGCSALNPSGITTIKSNAAATGEVLRGPTGGALPASQLNKKPSPRVRLLDKWTFLLLGLVALHVLSIALMVFVPDSQGLLVYCHWVKVPIGKNLRDLVSFRLPHGRNIEVQTSDGVTLKGWHILPSQQAAEASVFSMETPERDSFFDQALARPGERVVVYFHGNAATRGQWNRVELLKAMSSMLNAHVIVVDYRGFADSSGWPSEHGLLLDSKAIWAWLNARAADGTHAYLYGQSIGSGVAVKLAHALEGTQQRLPLTGVLLDAPFTNLSTAALYHPTALPYRIIPFIKGLLLQALKEKYPSIDLVQSLTCPVFVLHGRKDGMIPYHVGQELYQAGRLARLEMGRPDLLEDMWFGEFMEAGHNDIYAQPSWVGEVSLFMTTMEAKKATAPSFFGTKRDCPSVSE